MSIQSIIWDNSYVGQSSIVSGYFLIHQVITCLIFYIEKWLFSDTFPLDAEQFENNLEEEVEKPSEDTVIFKKMYPPGQEYHLQETGEWGCKGIFT